MDTLLFEDPTGFIICQFEEFGIRVQMSAKIIQNLHLWIPPSFHDGVGGGVEVVRVWDAPDKGNDVRTEIVRFDTVPAITVEHPLIAVSASPPSWEQPLCRRATPPTTDLERVTWWLLWNRPCL